jgi:hypothetical protein
MSLDSRQVSWSTQLGRMLARKVFEKRGNNSEIHIGENELAVILVCTIDEVLNRIEAAAKRSDR